MAVTDINSVKMAEEGEVVEKVSGVVTQGTHWVTLVQRVFQPHKPANVPLSLFCQFLFTFIFYTIIVVNSMYVRFYYM